MKKFIAALVFGCVLAASAVGTAFGAGDKVIANGKEVSFDYTLSVDGKMLESSQGKKPVTYTHGSGQIIPGLSGKLEGMRVGEEKVVVVASKDAYGDADPKAVREVPRASLPADIKPAPGVMLQAKAADGSMFPVRIREVKKDSVILDFNHPLAGKTLSFHVKVVSIQ